MFTGIITDTTTINGHQEIDGGLRLTFKKPAGWDDLELGESVATDGVCLTVAEIRTGEYDSVLVPETLAKTSFGQKLPAAVNLERSLSVSDRFGGHFVQGHVDGIGTVSEIHTTGEHRVEIIFDPGNKELVILKGSITVNGVALTIAKLAGNKLSVALVPHTLKHTTFSTLKVGDKVNLEFDMIGKYIARIMENRSAAS